MGVKLGRQIPIGHGVSGYEFEIRTPDREDRVIYERGLQIERDLQDKKRTSGDRTPPPAKSDDSGE
jgi:hypothetical protein